MNTFSNVSVWYDNLLCNYTIQIFHFTSVYCVWCKFNDNNRKRDELQCLFCETGIFYLFCASLYPLFPHKSPFARILLSFHALQYFSKYQNLLLFCKNAPCIFPNAACTWWKCALLLGICKAHLGKSKAHFGESPFGPVFSYGSPNCS